MAVLFISHSSKDDSRASAIADWLKTNGFSDVFIDHGSIAGGEKWRDALRASASACRIVICLVTENWLASRECPAEFAAAWYMGKRIIPLLLLPDTQLGSQEAATLERVLSEDAGIDLNPCLKPDGMLDLTADENVAERLHKGLIAAGANSKVGLDPEAFAIDRNLRPTPFPGLSSFGDEDADAALFFGRSREIAATLEELRAMRAARDRRPMMILGASGAGKSSLLKAGIIPRLRREAPAWLPLRAFRPGTEPLLSLAEAFSRTLSDCGQTEAPGHIRDRLLDVWQDAERGEDGRLNEDGILSIAAVLEAEGARLRSAADRDKASILVSIDQAEEIARSDDRGGEALADYLRAALNATETGWQLVFTIRTDSFPELQRHPRFQDLKARGYDLRPLPVFRFNEVVEDPARRYGVDIAPAMIDALMEEAPDHGALPLLAFAMQRLWDQYAASRQITETNYQAIGGLTGMIEDAAERALRGIEPGLTTPLADRPLTDDRETLAAATFVPALAQINDRGEATRRVADWRGLSPEARSLLDHFDKWRLIVRKGVEGVEGGTVEVSHEAVFAEWGRLAGWINKERQYLELERQIATEYENFQRAEGSNKGEFLLHGARLKEAWRAFRKRPERFASVRDFLQRSRINRRRRLAWILVAFSPLLWVIFETIGSIATLAVRYVLFQLDMVASVEIDFSEDPIFLSFEHSLIASIPNLFFMAYLFWLDLTARRARYNSLPIVRNSIYSILPPFMYVVWAVSIQIMATIALITQMNRLDSLN